MSQISPGQPHDSISRSSAGSDLPRNWHRELIALLAISTLLLVAGSVAFLWHRPPAMSAAVKDADVPDQFEPDLLKESAVLDETPPPAHGDIIRPGTELSFGEYETDLSDEKARLADAREAADPEDDSEAEEDAAELMRIIDAAAARRDWSEAARVLATVTAEFKVPLVIWHYRALACLKARDDTSYREICESMLNRVVLAPRNLDGINMAAWMCAIGPRAVHNPAGTVLLAEMLQENLPDQPVLRHAYLNTIGAVYLRAGRWREAVDALKDGIEGNGGEGVEQDWLLLALAHHGLDEEKEARRCLHHPVEPPAIDGPQGVWNRAEIDLLRAEATRTIEK